MIGLSWAVREAGRRVCLEQTLWQSGAVLHGAVRSTSSCSMAQVHYSMYTRKHHATTTNGLETLRPCSLSDVTVEGSPLSGSFRHFNLRIWPGDQGLDHNLERYGRRAFSVAGPSLWNNLPLTIREAGTLTTFKSMPKTHLFRIAFKALC